MAREKTGGKKSPLNTWVGGKSGKKGVKYYTARNADGSKQVMKVTRLKKGVSHVQSKSKYGADSDIVFRNVNPVKAQRSARKAQPRNAFQAGRYKKLID